MSFITFQCYACGQRLKVGADKAGRKAKCNKCGTPLTIPAAPTMPEAPPPSAAITPAPPGLQPPPLPPQPASPEGFPAGPGVPVEPVVPPDDWEDLPRPRRRRDAEGYDDEEDDRRERGGRPGMDEWQRARLGLLLVFIGACVLAGAFALELVAYLLLTVNVIQVMSPSVPPLSPGTGTATGVLLRVSLFVELAAGVTTLVGYVFCILGPKARGALALAIATTAATGLYLLLALIFKLTWLLGSQLAGGPGLGASWFLFWFSQLLIQLLFAAGFIVFPLYLRSLALLLGARRDTGWCLLVMLLGCAYAGERLLTYIFWYVTVNSFFTSALLTRQPPRGMIWVTLIFLWLGVFVFGALLVFYILRVWKTRSVIE
jgi:hypothetical protein